MTEGVTPKGKMKESIDKYLQAKKDFLSTDKEIYYIRDRATLEKYARIEKTGTEFVIYSISDRKLPIYFFCFPYRRDVAYTKDLYIWLKDRIYAESVPMCQEHMMVAQIPFYEPWVVFKGYSGRGTPDNLELVDENDNFTFYNPKWMKESTDYLNKVTIPYLKGQPIDTKTIIQAYPEIDITPEIINKAYPGAILI